MLPPTKPVDHRCVRSMTRADVAEVVSVHRLSFPGFFLTFLGPSFLALLYERTRSDPDGVALVAECGGRIEGFVAGTLHQAGFYARLVRQSKWRFAFAAGQALLRQPTIARRLVRALRRPAEAGEAAAEACLMSIAVRPDAGGRGIGRQLVGAFARELQRRDTAAFCLTTDRDDNERVNQFYRKLGFQLVRVVVTPEGRAMNEYRIDVSSALAICGDAPRQPTPLPAG